MTLPDAALLAALQKDEGLRLNAYLDTVGVWTIGYGQTGPDIKKGVVWTPEQASAALSKSAKSHGEDLERRAPWIANLDPVRRRVLWNMAFNLGVAGLLGFVNTLKMVRAGDYAGASRGMLASKWARQVKGRAVRLAEEMRTGIAK
jgi:lysozyme